MAKMKTALLVLLLAGGAAIAGEPAATVAGSDAAEKPAAEAADTKTTDTEAAKPVRDCPLSASTRIRSTPAQGCRSGIGLLRVHTQEELQRTGEFDTAAALRKIDPIFQ